MARLARQPGRRALRAARRPEPPAVHEDPHPARRRSHRPPARRTSSSPAIRSTWPCRCTTRATTSTAKESAELTGQPEPPTPRPPRATAAGVVARLDRIGRRPARSRWIHSPVSMWHLVRCVGTTRRAEHRARALRRPLERSRRRRCAGSRPGSASPSRRPLAGARCTRPRFDQMRARADLARARCRIGILKEPAHFFRRGSSGAGRRAALR